MMSDDPSRRSQNTVHLNMHIIFAGYTNVQVVTCKTGEGWLGKFVFLVKGVLVRRVSSYVNVHFFGIELYWQKKNLIAPQICFCITF